MNYKFLVLVPMPSFLQPVLVKRQLEMLRRLAESCPRSDIIIDRRDVPGTQRGHHGRQTAMCAMRNQIVERYVDPKYYTHVLMIDADTVEYPPDLPRRLARHEGCVVGTFNHLEGHPNRFFDTAGYVESVDGVLMLARRSRPHFTSRKTVIELESVGMVYLLPADVFTEGRYTPPPMTINGLASEHYSICQHAKRMGYKVIVDMSVRVVHAPRHYRVKRK